MAPHSSTLAWKIPWTEEPGGLQSMGSLRVGHDWATSLSLFTCMHWREWQPTPVFLRGESQGRRSLVGCHVWGRTESDTTEATQQQQSSATLEADLSRRETVVFSHPKECRLLFRFFLNWDKICTPFLSLGNPFSHWLSLGQSGLSQRGEDKAVDKLSSSVGWEPHSKMQGWRSEPLVPSTWHYQSRTVKVKVKRIASPLGEFSSCLAPKLEDVFEQVLPHISSTS